MFQEIKINCLIVDDEPMALALLEKYVEKTPYLHLIAKCSNAFQVLEVLNKQSVDLIYSDIQMPELNGMQLSETLPPDIRIIFTTAFDKYAIESYKVKAIDYLLKPFDYQEFLTASNKAREWFSILNKSKKTDEINSDKTFLFVKSEYKFVKIPYTEILYIEGLKDYVKIWLKDNPKPILSLMSLKSLEEELPKNDFMRIHRSYIVSLNKIEMIEKGQIIIKDKYISVSEQYKDVFNLFLKKNSLD